MRLPVCIALVLIGLTVGCASALREPPGLDELAGNGAEPSLESWSERAHALFERRELDSMRRAAELSLRAAKDDPSRREALVLATRAGVWLADHETGEARMAAAVKAVHSGQWCRRNFPEDPDCAYWLALALGVQARERRSTALDGLEIMVDLLQEVAEKRPELDHGGPHRVLALVLLRAPGWPAGPGDPDLGLEQARAAMDIEPEFPPNLLALAEALRETDSAGESRNAYIEAERLAEKRLESGESEAREWLEEARAELGGPAAE